MHNVQNKHNVAGQTMSQDRAARAATDEDNVSRGSSLVTLHHM